MKKLSIMFLVISLCATLFSCGNANNPAPVDVVDTYLNAVNTGDSETISKVYAGSDSFKGEKANDTGASDDSTGYNFDFEYSLSSEKINDDKATVNATIQTYQYGVDHQDNAKYDYERTVPISLTKTKDGWVIDDFGDNLDLMNALTGGLMDYIHNMENILGIY